MINLLSTQHKREIRAARLNVILGRYVGLSIGAIAFLVAVFGVGYIITSSERAAAQAELETRSQEANTYQKTQKEAADFSKNLATAKTILDSETVYSALLLKLASLVPPEVVLTTLNLDNVALTSGKPLTFDGETKNYNAVLAFKSKLETSDLFEKVNIGAIQQKPNAPGQPNPPYPLTVSINVTISKSALQKLSEVNE